MSEKRKYLYVRYDVTEFTDEEVARLEGEAWAQGETNRDSESYHPNAEVVSHLTEDLNAAILRGLDAGLGKAQADEQSYGYDDLFDYCVETVAEALVSDPRFCPECKADLDGNDPHNPGCSRDDGPGIDYGPTDGEEPS